METKFKNTYRIETTRLKNWDYASHGFYFVTICTKNKQPYFGRIANDVNDTVETENFASLRPNQIHTQIGDIAYRYWTEIPKHFPFVELDAFVIMPDHVHGILFLNRPKYESWRTNAFKPQSENLASIIRGYKAAVKKYAVINRIEFDWQPRYYDHVIHAEPELHAVQKYIEDNPIKWLMK
jgi:putative transposase